MNRVARELNIKPLIYLQIGKAGLRQAVALTVWRQYLTDYGFIMREQAELMTIFRI